VSLHLRHGGSAYSLRAGGRRVLRECRLRKRDGEERGGRAFHEARVRVAWMD
jgi:hypothetical protein